MIIKLMLFDITEVTVTNLRPIEFSTENNLIWSTSKLPKLYGRDNDK